MATEPSRLPDGSVLLHVGPQKTGSTAIQMAMHLARADLANQGVLYPGTRACDHEAGRAVLGEGPAIGGRPPRMARWDRLAEEISSTELPLAALSIEGFARADDAAIQRILAATDPERTHLVFVARRLDTLLPSYWQQRLKARLTTGYDDFLHFLLDGPRDDWEYRFCWDTQNVAGVLDRWAKYLPRDQMTVIVSEDSDRTAIPRAFEAMLGLSAGTLTPPDSSNVSMTYPEAETIRRLNRLSRDEAWTQRAYGQIIQSGAVRSVRGTRATPGALRLGLPEWAVDAVAERAEQQIADIETAGVRVIGDPSTLRVRGVATATPAPPPVETIDIDLAVSIVGGAVKAANRMHSRDFDRQLDAAERAHLDDKVAGMRGVDLVRLVAAKTLRRFVKR